jgi:hypothetical protein
MDKSKRNKLAGTSTGTSKSAKYFAANPDARAKKNKYNTEYHATTERKTYRAQLNQKNRKDKGYGDGKDLSHTKSGSLVKETRSTNRARNGKGNNPKLK